MRKLMFGVLPINALLLAIGLADLATTLFWLHTGRAIEVNPVMSAVLGAGLALFIGVKLLTLLAYVITMEWYRRHRSAAMARVVGNITVIAYVAIYTTSFACVNHRFFLG